MTDGFLATVTRSQTIGIIHPKAGWMRHIVPEISGEFSRDPASFSRDNIQTFNPRVDSMFGVIAGKLLNDSIWIQNISFLAKIKKTSFNERKPCFQCRLPLDRFHECTDLSVNCSHTFAVVHGEDIGGLWDHRRVDGNADSVQTCNVRKPRDPQRLGSVSHSLNCLCSGHNSFYAVDLEHLFPRTSSRLLGVTSKQEVTCGDRYFVACTLEQFQQLVRGNVMPKRSDCFCEGWKRALYDFKLVLIERC